MKKLAFVWIASIVLSFFLSAGNIFATGCDPTRTPTGCPAGQGCQVDDTKVPTVGTCITAISITPPKQGFATIGNAISNFFTIALVVAIVLVLLMLIIGAYEWITSGGDKEAVAKARNRIINALIGLVVLAVAFALARLAGQITGFPDIFHLILPAPNPDAPGI